jgi:hypothetical protein
MNEQDPVHRLRGIKWPAPSPELRARIQTTRVRPSAISWSDRLWFSRVWRVGMAAAATGFFALDYWAAPGAGPVAVSAREQAEQQTAEELVQWIGLPADAAAALAHRRVMASRAPALERAWLIAGDDR